MLLPLTSASLSPITEISHKIMWPGRQPIAALPELYVFLGLTKLLLILRNCNCSWVIYCYAAQCQYHYVSDTYAWNGFPTYIGPWSSCGLTSHGEWSLCGRVWTVRADRQSYGESAGKDKYYNMPITLEANSPVLSALFNMQGFWSKGRSSAEDPVGEGWGGWPWQRLQGHCFGIYWPWLWCGHWTAFYSESATH